MKGVEDALELCRRENDPFYFTVLMIESWLGDSIDRAVSAYAASKLAKDRNLQTGDTHRSFAEVFRDASDAELPQVLSSLFRFAEYDDPQPAMVARGILGLGTEHTRDKHPLEGVAGQGLAKVVPVMRRYVERLCQWLDAEVHWHAHEMSYLAPRTVDPDPEKRELAALGINQRCFAGLSESQRKWWDWHHSEAASRLGTSGKWLTIGVTAADLGTRSWSHPEVDEVTIRYWPLLLRHNWTFADMMAVVRDLLPGYRQPGAFKDVPPVYRSPLDAEATFAAHCTNVLGLRKAGRGKTAPTGKPVGYDVAFRLSGRSLNETG